MGFTIGKSGYNVTENFIRTFPYGVGSGGTSSTITVGGESYTMLTFTGSGTFTVTTAGMFDCMIMGGGESGGTPGGQSGGGGGGGALVISQDNYFAVGTYTVAIGGGGSISYVGKYASGKPLGAGRGGQIQSAGGAAIVGGFAGGNGTSVAGPNSNANGGGGGGGMGAVGSMPFGNSGYGNMVNGGNGGAGVDWSSWRGESAGTTYYAAGGGGGGGYGSNTTATGGTGGGGSGARYYGVSATAGTVNTGSGGGGASEGASAAAGGSGLVLIRFKN